MKISNKIGAWMKHSQKTYTTRRMSDITQIVIHHSATKTGSPTAYARYHVQTNDWPGIGYHYVIQQDGTVYKCQALTTVSWHTGNHNTSSVGICLTGDFSQTIPTEMQYEAACELVNILLDVLNLEVKFVKGHQECKGHAGKACPGFSMAGFRRQIAMLKGNERYPVLQIGDRGQEVSFLQQHLRQIGFSPGLVDGIFGPLTKKAVEVFQRGNRLSVDGIVGPNTWKQIVDKP